MEKGKKNEACKDQAIWAFLPASGSPIAVIVFPFLETTIDKRM